MALIAKEEGKKKMRLVFASAMFAAMLLLQACANKNVENPLKGIGFSMVQEVRKVLEQRNLCKGNGFTHGCKSAVSHATVGNRGVIITTYGITDLEALREVKEIVFNKIKETPELGRADYKAVKIIGLHAYKNEKEIWDNIVLHLSWMKRSKACCDNDEDIVITEIKSRGKR